MKIAKPYRKPHKALTTTKFLIFLTIITFFIPIPLLSYSICVYLYLYKAFGSKADFVTVEKVFYLFIGNAYNVLMWKHFL
jgi:hypothetical protein